MQPKFIQHPLWSHYIWCLLIPLSGQSTLSQAKAMFSQFVNFIHVVCGFLVSVFQLFFTGSSSWGLDVNQIRAFYVFIGILCVAWTPIYWEAVPWSWGFFLAMLVWTLGFAPAWRSQFFFSYRIVSSCPARSISTSCRVDGWLIGDTRAAWSRMKRRLLVSNVGRTFVDTWFVCPGAVRRLPKLPGDRDDSWHYTYKPSGPMCRTSWFYWFSAYLSHHHFMRIFHDALWSFKNLLDAVVGCGKNHLQSRHRLVRLESGRVHVSLLQVCSEIGGRSF